MSKRCPICGKKPMITVDRKKLRGHYNPTGKRRKYPNLQWVRLANGKRIKICAKCIKAMGKENPPKYIKRFLALNS
ncbi:50S ribosomal protein L28 [bacterium]|nr:50S ribosomal protein L28 [bacterium]